VLKSLASAYTATTEDAIVFAEREKRVRRVEVRPWLRSVGRAICDPGTSERIAEGDAQWAAGRVSGSDHRGCQLEDTATEAHRSLATGNDLADRAGGYGAGCNDASVGLDQARPAGANGREVVVFAQVG